VYALFTTEGVINQFLSLFGLSQNLMISKKAVYVFQTFIRVWTDMGWKAIIYIAAIAGVDTSLYEAAAVDGAGRLRRALHITIPGILPTFIVMLLGVADFVQTGTEQYLIFQNPLVSRNIEVLDLYAYKKGIQLMDYSYATAIGIFKSAVSIALLMLTNRLAKLIRGEAIV
jgi:putative aldouronate transport system permease protein